MKTCLRCGVPQDLQEFYKHSGMADGHLNICKTCKRLESLQRESECRKNPNWSEKERARNREKYHRLGYRHKQKHWDKDKPWKNSVIYKNMHRDLKIPDGYEMHHWNYSEEFLKDIFILRFPEHKKAHTFLIFDSETFSFKTESGIILDTKQKHLDYLIEKGIKI